MNASKHTGKLSTENSGKAVSRRAFTPPEASIWFLQAIITRMGEKGESGGRKRRGAIKRLADETGLDYTMLRCWIHKPIIPYLFADFLAFWLGVTLEDLMRMGVRLTLQTRKSKNTSKIRIKGPTAEAYEDPRFLAIVGLLQSIGCTVLHIDDGVLPKVFGSEEEKGCASKSALDSALHLDAYFKKLDAKKMPCDALE